MEFDRANTRRKGRNGMDFFTSDAFVTIVSVVVSVAGLLLALRADIGKRFDRVEKRIDRVEERTKEGYQALGQRIDGVQEGLGQRIDRVEERARANHQELVGEIGELKIAVRVVSAKLDERSAPQQLMVQEPPADYAVGDEPEDGPEPE